MNQIRSGRSRAVLVGQTRPYTWSRPEAAPGCHAASCRSRCRGDVRAVDRVMRAQADGAALLTQQTTSAARWLDRSNGKRGERRRPTTPRCRCRRSLNTNTPFKQQRRPALRPPRLQGRGRARVAARRPPAQTQSHLSCRQPRRVSKEVDIQLPSSLLQWIFLLRQRLAAELPALSEASDG